ncbi:MAG: hypothetical protein ACTHW0_02355, partial [Psychrobacter sp.]
MFLRSTSATSSQSSSISSTIIRSSLLSLSMALLLSACGDSDDSNNSNSNTPSIPDSPEVDTNWQPAGGSATISADISQPFLQIMPNLPSSALGGVSPGRELFITEWTPANVGRVLFDGVGPIFNANA